MKLASKKIFVLKLKGITFALISSSEDDSFYDHNLTIHLCNSLYEKMTIHFRLTIFSLF